MEEVQQEYLSIILPETLYILPEDLESDLSPPAVAFAPTQSTQSKEEESLPEFSQEDTKPVAKKMDPKELLLLINGSQSVLQDESHNTFIHKFRQALKVSQEQTELVFTEEISESVDLYLQERPFQKVISFGYEWKGVEKYSIASLQGKKVIVTDHLNALVSNTDLKKMLWKQCVSLFEIN